AAGMGWPGRSISWEHVVSSLADASTQRPETALRAGFVDPSKSSVGLAAVMSLLDQDADGQVTDVELGAGVALTRAVGAMVDDPSVYFAQFAEADPASGPAVAAFPALEADVMAYGKHDRSVGLVPVYAQHSTIL